MGKKRHQSQQGVGETAWGKKVKRLTAALSEEGYRLAKERAKALGIPFSEMVERWARGMKVDTESSVPVPLEIELVSKLQSIDTFELAKALADRVEEQAEDVAVKDQFIQNLIAGKLSTADIAMLGSVLELDEEALEQFWRTIQPLQKKGGKAPNGI